MNGTPNDDDDYDDDDDNNNNNNNCLIFALVNIFSCRKK
jgi:hypothetical protein